MRRVDVDILRAWLGSRIVFVKPHMKMSSLDLPKPLESRQISTTYILYRTPLNKLQQLSVYTNLPSHLPLLPAEPGCNKRIVGVCTRVRVRLPICVVMVDKWSQTLCPDPSPFMARGWTRRFIIACFCVVSRKISCGCLYGFFIRFFL